MTGLKILFYRLALKIRLFLSRGKTKAVILDRDGTLNRDSGYVNKTDDLELFPETLPALKKLSSAGYILIIITNQSGVGRGYFTLADVRKFNRRLVKILAEGGVCVAKIYICPHRPEAGCRCRKPETLLFEKAIREFKIDTALSWTVGDKETDSEAAKRAGIRPLQLGRDVKNLLEASEFIITRSD